MIDNDNIESLITHILLHIYEYEDNPGLLTGQMGILLTLAQYSRHFNKPGIELVADFILDNISEHVKRLNDISFSNGLSGICWGIEYLVQFKFMSGPTDTLCKDVDNKIMLTDIMRLPKESISGLAKYVWARITSNAMNHIALPFDSNYINDWIVISHTYPYILPKDMVYWLLNSAASAPPFKRLSLKDIITPTNNIQIENLSLSNGLCAFIINKYLPLS